MRSSALLSAAVGTLPPGATFARVFARPGHFAYRCTIHRFMRGEVNVYGLVLTGPEQPVLAGSRVVLRGLVRAGSELVALETLGGAGGERRARPLADGSLSFALALRGPASFRARAAGVASPTVRVRVTPRVALRWTAGRLVVAAEPARPGARVAIQVYDRERFAWDTVTRTRLDRQSRARVSVRGLPGAHVRAVLRGGRGWADGASRAIVVAF